MAPGWNHFPGGSSTREASILDNRTEIATAACHSQFESQGGLPLVTTWPARNTPPRPDAGEGPEAPSWHNQFAARQSNRMSTRREEALCPRKTARSKSFPLELNQLFFEAYYDRR